MLSNRYFPLFLAFSLIFSAYGFTGCGEKEEKTETLVKEDEEVVQDVSENKTESTLEITPKEDVSGDEDVSATDIPSVYFEDGNVTEHTTLAEAQKFTGTYEYNGETAVISYDETFFLSYGEEIYTLLLFEGEDLYPEMTFGDEDEEFVVTFWGEGEISIDRTK